MHRNSWRISFMWYQVLSRLLQWFCAVLLYISCVFIWNRIGQLLSMVKLYIRSLILCQGQKRHDICVKWRRQIKSQLKIRNKILKTTKILNKNSQSKSQTRTIHRYLLRIRVSWIRWRKVVASDQTPQRTYDHLFNSNPSTKPQKSFLKKSLPSVSRTILSNSVVVLPVSLASWIKAELAAEAKAFLATEATKNERA